MASISERLAAEFPEYCARPVTAPLALDGIVVVDLSHFLAGPYATMLLADLGADVIKVENTGGGDDLRYYPPAAPGLETQSAPFIWTNRSKRSIQLDLKTEASRDVMRDLIAKADVIIENFSTGVIERLGYDHASCAKINPRMISCSISAYGRTGSSADRRGLDPIAQAESGFLSLNGYPDREGVRAYATVMDISAGMLASNAILAALIARGRTGKGQAIEISLFEAAMTTMLGFGSMQHLISDTDPQRVGNLSPDTSPTGVFYASDTAFYMSCTNNGIFQRLFSKAVDRPDILADPDLATREGRLRRRDELFGILNSAFAEHPWSYWRIKLQDAAVPAGEVRTLRAALRSIEARERQIVERIAHPSAGWIPNIRSPMRFSETPVRDPFPPPALGEHQASVLRDTLGYTDEKIDALAKAGAIPRLLNSTRA